QLHAQVCPNAQLNRDQFEEVVGAMARSGLLQLADAVFEKDGKQIPFRKATLARGADSLGESGSFELAIRGGVPVPAAAKPRKKKRKPRTAARQSKTHAHSPAEDKLRAWRLGVAKREGVPAFRIMSDRVLIAIAHARPRTAAE